MPKNKLKTPDWILKGEEKPKKKTGGSEQSSNLVRRSVVERKIFKIRKCPKCNSFDVVVVTEKEAVGLWRCGKCGWQGKDVAWEELSEEEFMKYMDEKGEK